MNEAEIAQILRQAMNAYSYNCLSPAGLGIFKGVEKDGVTVTMRLDGIDLRITPATSVNVSEYEDKIKALEETVKEQKAEIAQLKKPVAKVTRREPI